MRRKNQKNLPKQQTLKKPKTHHSSELTFLEHVHELRARLFWIVAIVLAASVAGLQFKDQLMSVVMAPLDGQKLVYLTPGGGFSFIFTLAIYFGILVAIPVIVYHIYRFMQPLLGNTTRKLIVTFMVLSSLLAIGGAAFGYFVTIPAALHFLASFAGSAVTPNLTADSYLNFVVGYVLGLALLFQLPLLLFLFDHVRPFPPGTLIATQRFVIVGATVMAAIITPTPDAFNMSIVAVPVIAMYQFGVVAIYTRHRRVAKQHEAPMETREQQAPVVVEEVETPVVIEVPEPVARVQTQPSPPQSANRKSKVIDGFVRPHAIGSSASVPAARHQLSSAKTSTSKVRSVDGFGIASYQSNS